MQRLKGKRTVPDLLMSANQASCFVDLMDLF